MPLFINASISSSRASGSLNPFPSKNLIPLNSTGLWEADITTPASTLYFFVRYAIAGVGITPTYTTLAPTEQAPAIKAFASISPEIRVSHPTIIVGLYAFSFDNTYAPACPNCIASNGVSSSFATPRTPSVPNNLPIFFILQKITIVLISMFTRFPLGFVRCPPTQGSSYTVLQVLHPLEG